MLKICFCGLNCEPISRTSVTVKIILLSRLGARVSFTVKKIKFLSRLGEQAEHTFMFSFQSFCLLFLHSLVTHLGCVTSGTLSDSGSLGVQSMHRGASRDGGRRQGMALEQKVTDESRVHRKFVAETPPSCGGAINMSNAVARAGQRGLAQFQPQAQGPSGCADGWHAWPGHGLA